MKSNLAPFLVAVACLGASACRLPLLGGQAKAPVGEVAATWDGHEITVRDLQAELTSVRMPTDPAQLKQLQQAALQRILIRMILAKAAHDQGVDGTPDFAVQKQRVMDELLARGLETKIASSAPAPTREEAGSYMTSHPDVFAERKIFILDQIRIVRPGDDRLLKEIQPLDTLDSIAALLTREKISFQRGTAGLDTVGADPKIVDQILKLPPNEVFVMPSGNLILMSQIKETRVQPFTGDEAVAYAQNALKNQRQQDAVQRQVALILAKAKTTIRYNKAYQPALPAKPAAAPATPSAGAGNVG